MPQDEFDTLYKACFNARPEYHVERTTNAGEYVVRCLGGRITVTEQHVDKVLLDESEGEHPVLRAETPLKHENQKFDQKFDFEERGYFGITKKCPPKKVSSG